MRAGGDRENQGRKATSEQGAGGKHSLGAKGKSRYEAPAG
jgi:hypothetical protein